MLTFASNHITRRRLALHMQPDGVCVKPFDTLVEDADCSTFNRLTSVFAAIVAANLTTVLTTDLC